MFFFVALVFFLMYHEGSDYDDDAGAAVDDDTERHGTARRGDSLGRMKILYIRPGMDSRSFSPLVVHYSLLVRNGLPARPPFRPLIRLLFLDPLDTSSP